MVQAFAAMHECCPCEGRPCVCQHCRRLGKTTPSGHYREARYQCAQCLVSLYGSVSRIGKTSDASSNPVAVLTRLLCNMWSLG